MDQLALFSLPANCSERGCARPAIARRMCTRHYNRYRRSCGVGRSCAIEACSSPVMARGWCNRHYLRWRNNGDPLAGGPAPRVAKAIDHPDGTRTCLDCETVKPLSEFPKDRNATKGRRSNCKPCHTRRAKDWYAANRDEHLPRQKARYRRDIDKMRERDRQRYERDKPKRIELAIESVHRRRALLQSAPSDRGITRRALRQRHGDLCHYCRQAMTFEPVKNGTYVPTRATIEHVVPLARGGHHTWDNTVLACWQCNVRKNVTPLDEWIGPIEVA